MAKCEICGHEAEAGSYAELILCDDCCKWWTTGYPVKMHSDHKSRTNDQIMASINAHRPAWHKKVFGGG